MIILKCLQKPVDLRYRSAQQLADAVELLKSLTNDMLKAMGEQNIDLALANSVKYLDVFGNIVIAWLWLWQGQIAAKALANNPHEADENFYRGKLQAMQYFFRYDLPEIKAWADLLSSVDDTCFNMKNEWF